MTIPEYAFLSGVMDEAIEHCIRHVAAGGLPFVGVVIDQSGEVISEFGVNQVRETSDQTAHAEIVAMRDAMIKTGRDDLTGTVLLATGEPCGLCYRFALDHGVDAIYIAVDRDTAAAWGFDYRGSYRPLGITDRTRSALYRSMPSKHGEKPFLLYREALTGQTRR